MKYLAAYSLLVLSGNPTPSAQDIEKLLKDVGAQANKENIAHLIKCINGQKLHDLYAKGSDKFVSMPAGGAVAVSSSAGPVAETKEKEAPKEEPKEEEADVDMGGLFGDDEY
mmetsp:Transcript_35822/g.34860  ORF Transcript_35822/g.34860 Transcript_35822/m.34860 type:complete len:112 (+) Transcript_35822:42-377(+)|eukprot:CAMPEP_0170556062 /NCGR_PEP_ID=MMETSP0211-20121228/15403_1 /TAXON_ID=311385 /ORGANISM="Pseudokeronopsis sp., Strain OXSARD2" /LENGTH=111 /DNA_ID=CAMNT_0010866165 /DNA_START=8 /DNA_END=343 /DNA_ORIENTATION=+